MTYLITFLDNNEKYAVYTGGNIHGLYHYLEMIGSQTTFTTSSQRSYHFGPPYFTKMIQQISSQLLQFYT